jgi:hypothetical protein
MAFLGQLNRSRSVRNKVLLRDAVLIPEDKLEIEIRQTAMIAHQQFVRGTLGISEFFLGAPMIESSITL